MGSPQYNFLAADLATVDRCLTPWVIANGHRPVSPPCSDLLMTPAVSLNVRACPSRLAQHSIL